MLQADFLFGQSKCNMGPTIGSNPAHSRSKSGRFSCLKSDVFFLLKSFARTITTQSSVTLGAMNTIGIALIALSVGLASTLSPGEPQYAPPAKKKTVPTVRAKTYSKYPIYIYNSYLCAPCSD